MLDWPSKPGALSWGLKTALTHANRKAGGKKLVESLAEVQVAHLLYSVCQAGGGEERAAGIAFGGGLEAKHQFSPNGGAGNEIIRLRLPVGVGETQLGAGFCWRQLEEQFCAVPFVAGGAEPLGV